MSYPHEIAHGGFENPHCNGGKDLWSFENPRRIDGMGVSIWHRTLLENPRRKDGKDISIWYRISFENLCLHGREDHFIKKWYVKIIENCKNLGSGIENCICEKVAKILRIFLSIFEIHARRDALTSGHLGHVPNRSNGD